MNPSRTFARVCRYGLLLGLLVLPPAIRAQDAAPPPEPKKLILPELLGTFGQNGIKWKENWAKDNAQALTDPAALALKVATHPELSRERLREEIKAGGTKVKAAPRNLDVGRHDLVKYLFARACERANQRLAAEKLTPLTQVTTVNSGGTGDFTRDIDITAFGGDEVREQYFFEALVAEANALRPPLQPDPNVNVKHGVNFPQIDVAIHRGNNDLPDPRLASDVHTFAADYRRVIESQSKNPEAYFGYGFEVEVQGRRSLSFKPGQTLVQEFVCEPGKAVQYRGQIASCQREVRAILRGSMGQRYRRAQNASHITNHFLQAFRHEQGSDHDLTKGSLKYAGRTIEALCEYHGMKNWPDLLGADRMVVLKSLFPPGYGDTPAQRQTLEHLAQSVDVAYLTFVGKKVPPTAGGQKVEDPARDAEMCLRFMQRAVATTASAVAAEMIDPPAFDPKFLADAAARSGKPWDLMNPQERAKLAMEADANYKKCCSVAAMENLLCIVQQVRQLDLPEYNKHGTTPGKEALMQMLESADERTRPILELAIDHAEAAVTLDTTKDPVRRKLAQERLKGCRKRLEALTLKPAAGETVIEKAGKLSADDFASARRADKPTPLAQDYAELKARFLEHLEEAFPPTDLAGFRAHLREVGVKNYMVQKLAHEVASPATVLDIVNLIEIYQEGGGAAELGKAAGISLVNRGHWALGFLIQAGEVRTEKDLCELGKNVVFDAFARLIPGVGTVKIVFDIEKGLVNITVGYTINQLNADLIDALYTGEAGRINDGTAGKVAGRLRDSGFCLLDERYVRKETDPKTQKVSVVIDRPAMYVDFFKQFTGRDYDDRTTPIGERKAGGLARAHDTLIRLWGEQASCKEPAWFGEATTIAPSPEQVQQAMAEYAQALEGFCRAAAQKVLAESAVREYIKDGKDVIEEGLVSRFTQDLLLGTMSTWQTRQIERVEARRDVESTANFADLNQMALAIREKIQAPPTDKPEYGIEVGVAGSDLGQDQDGSAPIPFQFVLRGSGEAPPVAFVVEDGPLSPPGDGKEYRPKERVKQSFTVRAVTEGGGVLAETSFTVSVILPDKKGAGPKLLEYVGKDENGKVYLRYTYYEASAFKDPKTRPSAVFKSEGGKVYHGDYVEYDSQGRIRIRNKYAYGHLDGTVEAYDTGGDRSGQIVHWKAAETQYAMGKEVKHTCFYPDGSKNWDMEYDAQGRMTSQTRYWGEGEKVMEKGTYRPQGTDRVEGTFLALWKDGLVRIKSDFRTVGVGVLVTAQNIESIRHGPWEMNHKTGQPAERGQADNAVPVGTWHLGNDKGQPTAVIVYDDKGKAVEEEKWAYWDNGNLKTHTHVKDGKNVGEWLENYENGKLAEKKTYASGVLDGPCATGNDKGVLTTEGAYANGAEDGLWTRRGDDGTLSNQTTYSHGKKSGPQVSYHANGKVSARCEYKDDAPSGKYESRRENGTLDETGGYVGGKKDGLWVYYDDKGVRKSWEEFKNGQSLRSGTYKDQKQ